MPILDNATNQETPQDSKDPSPPPLPLGPIDLTDKKKIIAALCWGGNEADTASIDLDVVACAFNKDGQFMECVYFNNLRAADGALMHTGDEKASGREEVVVDLVKMPAAVSFVVFAVSSYAGYDLHALKGLGMELLESKGKRDSLLQVLQMPVLESSFSAYVAGKLVRQAASSRSWTFKPARVAVQARSFADVLPEMQRALQAELPSIQVQPLPQSLSLVKGETVVLASKENNVDCVTLGLGWDMMGSDPIDLDGSCVMFSDKGTQVDHVYFSKLFTENKSVIHQGDNTTGEGQGDDEKIFANLQRLPSNVHTLFFVINSYSGHTFDSIKNAYVRLLHTSSHAPWAEGREICRFSLSGSNAKGRRFTSMLMCKLERRAQAGTWTVKALGVGGQGRMFQDSVPMMQKELAGRLVLSAADKHFSFAPTPRAAPKARGGLSSLFGSAADHKSGHANTTTAPAGTATKASNETNPMLLGLCVVLFLLLLSKLS